jgi:hypothetical protein
MQLPVSPLPDGRGRAPPWWGTSANTRRSAALHAVRWSRTGTATTGERQAQHPHRDQDDQAHDATPPRHGGRPWHYAGRWRKRTWTSSTTWPSGRCGPGGGSGSWSGTWPVARSGSAGTGAAAPAPATGPTAARSSRSAPSPRSSPGCCWPTSPSEGSSAWTTRWPGTCRRRPPCRPPEDGRSPSPTSPAIPVGCGATPRGCWAGG